MAYSLADLGHRQVIVAVHTKKAPSDEEWRGFAALIESHAKRVDF